MRIAQHSFVCCQIKCRLGDFQLWHPFYVLMDPSNANPEEAGGLTHPQGPEPHTALTQDPVRSRCRIHCSAVNPDFKYTSPSHTLVKQVFFKFLLEVRSKALSSGLKRHVVVLELYDVVRGMLHMRQQLLLYRRKKCQELNLCWLQCTTQNLWNCAQHIKASCKVRLLMYLHDGNRSQTDPCKDSCHC